LGQKPQVGVAIGTDTKRRAMLFDVVNTRYREMRPTILIGDLTAAEMETYLGEFIMDRLLETGSPIVFFTWPSDRRSHGAFRGGPFGARAADDLDCS
jgi:DNA replication protein DnaC